MNTPLLSIRMYFFFLCHLATITTIHAQEKQEATNSIKNISIEKLAQIITNKKGGNIYEKTFFNNEDENINLQNYIQLGEALYNLENYKQSVVYFSKAADLAREIDDNRLLFISTIKQSQCYMQSWKNEKAIEAYYNALTIARENKNIDQEIIAYSGLIAILPLINKEDKAIAFSIYTLSLVKKSTFENKKNHVRLLTTIADAYLAKGDYDNMLTHVDTGIAIAEKLNFKEGLLDLYIKKGRIYNYKRQWPQAFEYLYKAETILKEGNITHRFFPMIYTNYYLAISFYDLKEYDKAIAYLLKTLDLLKDEDLEKVMVVDTHYLLAKCYLKKGNSEEAIKFLTKVIELKDRVQNKKDKVINEFHEQDSEKLLSQIEGLQGQLKKDKKANAYMLIWIAIILSILFIVVAIYIKKQKANEKKFKTLLQQITELEKNKSLSSKKTNKNLKSIVIDIDTIEEIIKRLDKLEEQEYFLHINCNLRSMAKKTKTNATYLSQIINSHKGKNFNDYINDLRIEYVLERLKNDKRFRSFSIKGIATELGYKSDYSFTKHFKMKTGLYPSYYIKEINKLVSSESKINNR